MLCGRNEGPKRLGLTMPHLHVRQRWLVGAGWQLCWVSDQRNELRGLGIGGGPSPTADGYSHVLNITVTHRQQQTKTETSKMSEYDTTCV